MFKVYFLSCLLTPQGVRWLELALLATPLPVLQRKTTDSASRADVRPRLRYVPGDHFITGTGALPFKFITGKRIMCTEFSSTQNRSGTGALPFKFIMGKRIMCTELSSSTQNRSGTGALPFKFIMGKRIMCTEFSPSTQKKEKKVRFISHS